jgi:hypothetical protein
VPRETARTRLQRDGGRAHDVSFRTYASSRYTVDLDGHSSRAHGAGSRPRVDAGNL